MSVSTENFIKCVYSLINSPSTEARSGEIATRLNITRAAVTDMAKKLANQNLVIHKKYQQLELTLDGKKMAVQLVRKHRLWETFLFKVFELSLEEIHHEAELLEHQTSDFMAQKLSEFLGNPEFDPHGDPIPDENGKIPKVSDQLLLTKTEIGQSYVISRMLVNDKDWFNFCEENGLNIGTRLTITNKMNNNEMIGVQINNSKLVLNNEIALKIFVNPYK